MNLFRLFLYSSLAATIMGGGSKGKGGGKKEADDYPGKSAGKKVGNDGVGKPVGKKSPAGKRAKKAVDIEPNVDVVKCGREKLPVNTVRATIQLTLSVALADLTKKQIKSIESSCVERYNELSLVKGCGETASLVTSCQLISMAPIKADKYSYRRQLQNFPLFPPEGSNLPEDNEITPESLDRTAMLSLEGDCLSVGCGDDENVPYEREPIGDPGRRIRVRALDEVPQTDGTTNRSDEHRNLSRKYTSQPQVLKKNTSPIFPTVSPESPLCMCQDGDGPNVAFEEHLELIIQDNNDLIIGGQEINEVGCKNGKAFLYELMISFPTDPAKMTKEEIDDFEELFNAEANEVGIRLCDPELYYVLASEVVVGSSQAKGNRFVVPFNLVAVQFNGATTSTPLFENYVRRRAEASLASMYGNEKSLVGAKVGSVVVESSSMEGRDLRSLGAVSDFLGDKSDGPCFCEFSRAPDGIPILQEDVTIDDINEELAGTPNAGSTMIKEAQNPKRVPKPTSKPTPKPVMGKKKGYARRV